MKNRKSETVASVLIIVFFLGFIFSLGGLTLYSIKIDDTTFSYFENRNLAVFPEKEKETILNGKFFSGVEDWLRDHSFKRGAALTADTILNMDILKRPVVNQVVIGDDVLLPYNKPETVDYEEIKTEAEAMGSRLLSHSDLCRSYGGQFYYVAVPCQYVYYESSYPWYLNSRAEYTAASSSALFSELDKNGVSYIDMMKIFDEKGHPAEFSSSTDNHYSIFGAYETYKAILEKINEDTDLNLHIMTEDDYTVTTLPNPYIGSRTRKLLGLRKSDEKLSIIEPKENIPFTRWNWGGETPGAPIIYSLPATPEEDVLYGIYMNGDNADTRIETNRPSLPTILIYGDSFTNPVEGLIWYNCDTMYSLDFRYYKNMTLEAFIEEKKPDIVVCIRDYEQLINYEFNGQ